MATNYPTSLDTLTNPVSNDSLNSPSHSAQHANANDAIEAIEAKLGLGANVLPYAISSGTGTTDGSGVLAITFPASKFNRAPILTATVASTSGSFPATTLSHASVTASGATLFSANSTTGAARASTPVNWIAIQMTSASSSG